MKRKLIYVPLTSYTSTEVLNKVLNKCKEKFGEFYPVFLDPANCQYNGNEIRVKELEKKIKDPILCFANFTRTLKEQSLWWDKAARIWQIYFWGKDENLHYIQDLTSFKLKEFTNIKTLYEQKKLDERGIL